MNLLIWLLLGLISGWIAGELYQGAGFGLIGNILVGIAGSFLGGWLGDKFGVNTAQNGINIRSILTAVVGAIVLLFVLGLIF